MSELLTSKKFSGSAIVTPSLLTQFFFSLDPAVSVCIDSASPVLLAYSASPAHRAATCQSPAPQSNNQRLNSVLITAQAQITTNYELQPCSQDMRCDTRALHCIFSSLDHVYRGALYCGAYRRVQDL
jgi:hypothetical protein